MSLDTIKEQGTGSQFVLLRMHHLIGDHASLELVVSEVGSLLSGRGAGLPLPVRYRDYVADALARKARRGGQEETFFRAKLADVYEPTAPFGLMDVRGDGSQVDEAQQLLEPGLSQRVRRCARTLGVSAATLFHVAWALVLSRTCGRDDVVFGTVLLGRMHGGRGVQQAVGMFINTLPLRLRLAGRGAREMVQEAHRELLELLEHEQAELVLAQRASGLSGGAPLFTSLFNYRHSSVRTSRIRQAPSTACRSWRRTSGQTIRSPCRWMIQERKETLDSAPKWTERLGRRG